MATPAPDPTPRRSLRPALTLAVLAGALAAILAVIASLTHERIEHNEQAWLTARLNALLARGSYDNDPLTDHIEVRSSDLAGADVPVTAYRARLGGKPVAALLRPVAPDGYRGAIELLVAVAYDGSLIGVQVLAHHETPGLGDAFERREAGWLERFRGRSLANTPPQSWTVKPDGGDFDAFTGATITPRAITKAVRRSLEYYNLNRDRIFEAVGG
jgi:electron transport complex protein RnfG